MNKLNIEIEEILKEIRRKNKEKDNLVKVRKAEKLLKKLKEYKKYCRKEKQEEFSNYLESLIYSPLIPMANVKVDHLDKMINQIDYEISYEIYTYIKALKIMKRYEETKSFDNINNYSYYTLANILDILLRYSNIGKDFADTFCKEILKENIALKKMYQDEIERIKLEEQKMERKNITPVIEEIINCENSIEFLLNNKDNSNLIEKTELDNYQEITYRTKDISITKINDNNEIEYIILDKRYYESLVKIVQLDEEDSYIKMTITDIEQTINIGEVQDSKTIKEYFKGLNEYIITINTKKKGQVIKK